MLISTRLLCIVIVVASITVDTNSQTCDSSSSQYGSCSLNDECGCLKLSFSDSMSVCGLLNLNCSQFLSCQSPDDACQQSQHICVRHPRCQTQPICYPLFMINRQVCPILTVSNYSSALTIEDGIYIRPGGSSNTHYEAIQLIVPTTGYYNLTSLSGYDTHGYLYNGTFYPSNPQLNLIADNDDGANNNQFKLSVFLQAGVPYTLVVSTHPLFARGPFSIVATGPDNIGFIPINPITTTTTTSTRSPIITTQYSNALTLNSTSFDRTGNSSSNYYYQAIQVKVDTTGNYTFRCSSGIDTYGYIYQGNFYPIYPTFNIHQQDDDKAGSGQFQLTAELRSDITYILVVTTFSPSVTGSFSVTASGPGNTNLIPINNNIS